MSVEVKGMQELIDALDKMEKVGDKTVNKALREAGDYVKDVEVKVAKSKHKKYSDDVGWKELKRYPIKMGKKGGKFVNIGIRASVSGNQKKKEIADAKAGVHRATHWDRIKGLFFNNYGFFHNRTGEYIAGSNWIGEAYENSIEEAYSKIREEIEKGLDL